MSLGLIILAVIVLCCIMLAALVVVEERKERTQRSAWLFNDVSYTMRSLGDVQPGLQYSQLAKLQKRKFLLMRNWTLALSDESVLHFVHTAPEGDFTVSLETTLSNTIGLTKIEQPYPRELLRIHYNSGLDYEVLTEAIMPYLPATETDQLPFDIADASSNVELPSHEAPVGGTTGMSESRRADALIFAGDEEPFGPASGWGSVQPLEPRRIR